MIQRIQTLYLFSSAFLLSILLWIPFISSESTTYTLLGGQIHRADGSTIIDEVKVFPPLVKMIKKINPTIIDDSVVISFFLLVIPFLLLIIAIFLFKKRKLQIRLVYSGMLFIVVFLIGFMMAIASIISSNQANGIEFSPLGSLGMLVPFIALVLAWLAARNIKKDEELVRSADRIR